uniref:Uncharacterized protein n=1 Tax=Arundo donax TaxID=35708 RepID=A0A0A9FRV5_ARUDO
MNTASKCLLPVCVFLFL